VSHSLLSAGDASSAARRWRDAARRGAPAVAGGVAAPAQPFLAAWLAEGLERTLCVVCPDVKRQEEFFHDLRFWNGDALLVPDLELSAAGATPDPELAAARLGALPGIGAMKVQTIMALLARQYGVELPGLAALLPAQRTLGDVTTAAELADYQAGKRAAKAARRAAAQ